MPPPGPIPLDSQLCFSLYGTTIAINRAYKPLLDDPSITIRRTSFSASLGKNGQMIPRCDRRAPKHHHAAGPAQPPGFPPAHFPKDEQRSASI